MKKAYSMIIMVLMLLLSQTAEAATVNIDLNSTNQTIRGFGGMNFPRWGHGLQNDAQVDTAFGNGPGQLGFTIMRIDVPPDSNDWSGAVAAAQRAINNHGAIVLASPWSPPASMKTNYDLVGGELRTDAYDDFANYLTDFANYMDSNGAPLFAISVQNEPDWLPDYESCGYSPSQMQTFLNNNASVIPTKVLAPETVHYKSDYVSTVASSSECDIIGVHLYGGSITYYSGKEYWQTEHYTSSDIDGNVWPDALEVGKEIHDCMTANMNAYIWWYIRRFYGPIDEDGNVTKRGYVMSHFAKFARPGYIRIDATANPSSGVYVTAYKSGITLVIVAINQNSSSSSVTFSLSGGSVDSYTKYETSSSNNVSNMGSVGSTDTLAANSINTYVGYTGGPVQTLTVSSTSGGSVTTPGEGDFQYTRDSNATIIATPDQYYHFVNWTGSAVDEGKVANPDANNTTVLMDANYAVAANFEADPPDLTPPEPNIMTWASVPAAMGSSSITMTATTAIDADSPPVKYYFECTTDGDANSGWQEEETYIAQGLNPLISYTFRVKARDNYLTPNETAWSVEESATTYPPSGGDVEIIGSWGTGLNHAKESGDNRALIFIAHNESPSGTPTLTSVTYDNKVMAKVVEITASGSSDYKNYVAAFILNEAGVNAATSGDFNPTWSDTPGAVAYASVFLQNVDQTAPVGDSNSVGTGSGTNPIETGALSTEDGDMVIVGATCGNLGTYTLNNGFTEGTGTDQQFGNSTTGGTGVAGYKSATGVAETPKATYSETVNRQVLIGFVVQAGGEWLYGDFTGDDIVDMNDMPGFCWFWLMDDCSDTNAIDLNEDCVINFQEYSFLAQNWLDKIE